MDDECTHDHIRFGTCKIATVAGQKVHWTEAGSGPAVVLVHGSQAWGYTWRYQIEPLAAAGFRAIAVDLPGSGYSELTLNYPDSIRGLSDFLVNFLDTLDLPLAIFIANSAGGLPVLDLAIRHPHRVTGLVLASSCGVPHLEPLLWRIIRLPGVGEVVRYILSWKLVRNTILKMVYDKSRVTDEMVSAYYQPLRRVGAWKMVLRIERNWQPGWVETQLKKVAVPKLIVWGEDDRIHPKGMAYEFSRRIPNALLELFSECGHLVQEERPEVFNPLIVRFLTRVAYGYALWGVTSDDPFTRALRK